MSNIENFVSHTNENFYFFFWIFFFVKQTRKRGKSFHRIFLSPKHTRLVGKTLYNYWILSDLSSLTNALSSCQQTQKLKFRAAIRAFVAQERKCVRYRSFFRESREKEPGFEEREKASKTRRSMRMSLL